LFYHFNNLRLTKHATQKGSLNINLIYIII